MSDEEVRITLRLPASLRDKLQDSATDRSRSMNGEILERLDWSFDRAKEEKAQLLELVHTQDSDLKDLREKLKAPTAEISRLSKLLAQEREAFIRVERLYDSTFDVAMNYRELLRASKQQSLQYLGMVDALASIVMTLQEAPSEDLVKVAGKMHLTASEFQKQIREETAKYDDQDVVSDKSEN